jgi:hypothetical protein
MLALCPDVWCRDHCTSILDARHRAGGNNDHAGLGCDKFLTEEVSQVVLGYVGGRSVHAPNDPRPWAASRTHIGGSQRTARTTWIHEHQDPLHPLPCPHSRRDNQAYRGQGSEAFCVRKT